jgi:Mn2+/Fe2+ NRAMP family transporter
MEATFLPHLELNFQFLFIITGVLGMTISPYMFFCQASEETEEEREAHLLGKDGVAHITRQFMRYLRIGRWLSELLVWLTFLGMGAAAVAMFATLGQA